MSFGGGAFGSGVLKQAARTEKLEQGDRGLDIESERVQLFRDQLTQKRDATRIKGILDTADTMEADLIKFGQAIKANKELDIPANRDLIARGLKIVSDHRSVAQPGGGSDFRQEFGTARAQTPPPEKQFKPSVFEQELGVFREQIQRRDGREASPDEIINFMQARKPAGTSIVQNPDGTFRVTVGGTQGDVSGQAGATAGATPLSAKDVQETSAGIEAAKSGVATVDAMLALPKGTLGAEGKLRRVTRETGRVAGDVASLGLPDALNTGLGKLGQFADDFISVSIKDGTLTPEQAKQFQRDPLTDAKGLQQRLAFLYARALQPTGDRLLKATIDEAFDATNFDSLFISEQTARERLAFMRTTLQELQERITRTVPKVGGPPAQGTAETQPTAAPPAAFTKENPAQPETQADFDALPSGSFFTDDEGLKVK